MDVEFPENFSGTPIPTGTNVRQEWGIQEPGDHEPCWLCDTEQEARSHMKAGDRLWGRTITDWEEVDD